MLTFDLESSKIKHIAYDEKSLDIFIGADDTLVIRSRIKGDIIDTNFNELDNRLSDIEAQLKMRFVGELQRLRGENEQLSKRIASLENQKS